MSEDVRVRSIRRRLGVAGAGLALAVGLGACGAAPTPASLALTPAAAAASSTAPAPSAGPTTTAPSPRGRSTSPTTSSSRARAAAAAPAARTTARKPPAATAAGTYTNSDGQQIERPDANTSGASARCRDGSFSHSTHRQGTCSGHGGVASWL